MKNSFTSKSDLAQAYFPHIGDQSARHKLMNLINTDPILFSQLQATGYKPLARSFSPAQVHLIYERFGNPFK